METLIILLKSQGRVAYMKAGLSGKLQISRRHPYSLSLAPDLLQRSNGPSDSVNKPDGGMPLRIRAGRRSKTLPGLTAIASRPVYVHHQLPLRVPP